MASGRRRRLCRLACAFRRFEEAVAGLARGLEEILTFYNARYEPGRGDEKQEPGVMHDVARARSYRCNAFAEI